MSPRGSLVRRIPSTIDDALVEFRERGALVDVSELERLPPYDDLFVYNGRQWIIERTHNAFRADLAAQVRGGATAHESPIPDLVQKFSRRRENGEQVLVVHDRSNPQRPLFLIRQATDQEDWYYREHKRKRNEEGIAAQREARVAKRVHKTPVSLAMCWGHAVEEMTLRAAAAQLLDCGGTIDVVDGVLVVSVPTASLYCSEWVGALRSACTHLFMAEPTVVEWVNGGRVASLPDQHVTPAGALLPDAASAADATRAERRRRGRRE